MALLETLQAFNVPMCQARSQAQALIARAKAHLSSMLTTVHLGAIPELGKWVGWVTGNWISCSSQDFFLVWNLCIECILFERNSLVDYRFVFTGKPMMGFEPSLNYKEFALAPAGMVAIMSRDKVCATVYEPTKLIIH